MKKNYIPDRTWKNAWQIIRSKKNPAIVLSCKNCPQGVSPKGKGYYYAGLFLAGTINVGLISFFEIFLDYPKEWCSFFKNFCACLLTLACDVVVAPVCVLLTLRFSRWVPTQLLSKGDGLKPQKNSGFKRKQRKRHSLQIESQEENEKN